MQPNLLVTGRAGNLTNMSGHEEQYPAIMPAQQNLPQPPISSKQACPFIQLHAPTAHDLEAIAIRFHAIATRVEAIAIRFLLLLVGGHCYLGAVAPTAHDLSEFSPLPLFRFKAHTPSRCKALPISRGMGRSLDGPSQKSGRNTPKHIL